ncbi:MAG: glycosyltransferase [Chloroflexota bacterium]
MIAQNTSAKDVTKLELVFDGQSSPGSWPSVSFCMIVKNEQKSLAACLKSIGDFASELIIVDTGSTDRTVEIARAFGAQVRHFDWIDDFAAARNESLKDASGEWILWLDADDQLSPQNLARLKQALVSGQADVYACRVVSQGTALKTSQTATYHLRLFRNRRGLHFAGAVHETVVPVQPNQNIKVAYTNITIEHTGYVITTAALQAKAQRNLQIIQKCLAREPYNLHWRHHQGISLSILGDYAGAAEAFESVLAQPPASLSWEIDVYQAYVSLMAAYVKLGCLQEAYKTLDRALKLFPQRRHLAITAGMFYLTQDEPEQAVTMLKRAKTLAPESDALGHAWAAGTLEEQLCLAHLLLGDFSGASEASESRLTQLGQVRQSLPDPIWRQAQALVGSGAFDRAIDVLSPLAAGDPAALRFLAQLARQHQHWDEAAHYLGQAIALSEPQAGEWTRLASIWFLRTGKAGSALRLCQRALADNYHDTAAHKLLDLFSQPAHGPWSQLNQWVQLLLTTPTHPLAHNALQELAEVLGLPPVELIRIHGLRLLNQEEHLRAAEAFSLIVNLVPNDAEAYKSLAVALQRLGQNDDAVIAWRLGQQLSAGPISKQVNSE